MPWASTKHYTRLQINYGDDKRTSTQKRVGHISPTLTSHSFIVMMTYTTPMLKLTPLPMHDVEHYCYVAIVDGVVHQGEVANLGGAQVHVQVEMQPASLCLPIPIQQPPRPNGK